MWIIPRMSSRRSSVQERAKEFRSGRVVKTKKSKLFDRAEKRKFEKKSEPDAGGVQFSGAWRRTSHVRACLFPTAARFFADPPARRGFFWSK
jgi:hypothetical protein